MMDGMEEVAVIEFLISITASDTEKGTRGLPRS